MCHWRGGGGGVWGGKPIKTAKKNGKAPPEFGTFFRLQVYEWLGNSMV